jgi:hypothetical protein
VIWRGGSVEVLQRMRIWMRWVFCRRACSMSARQKGTHSVRFLLETKEVDATKEKRRNLMMGRGRTTAVEDHRFPKERAREVAVK